MPVPKFQGTLVKKRKRRKHMKEWRSIRRLFASPQRVFDTANFQPHHSVHCNNSENTGFRRLTYSSNYSEYASIATLYGKKISMLIIKLPRFAYNGKDTVRSLMHIFTLQIKIILYNWIYEENIIDYFNPLCCFA